MKILNKSLFYLVISLIFLNGCTSLKEGLTGKKKSNVDEFLVKKKNPLVLPPEYGKLPEPGKLEKKNNSDKTTDIRVILDENKNPEVFTSIKKTKPGSVEKSILKNIKD